MKRHRVAVVGCGALARGAHLPNCRRNRRVELVAVCDIDPRAAEQCREKFGAARAETDWRRVVAAADIDVCVLCTHTNLRGEFIVPALESGKAVYTEKPLAPSRKEMLDAASHAALGQMPAAAGLRLDIATTVGARMIPKAAELAGAWVKPGFDDQAWAALESYDNNTGVGHAYLRIRFQVPDNVPSEGYLLDLGTADDYDETYLNGVKIGSVNPENTPEIDAPWAKRRLYPIPPKLLKPGAKNLLAIYVWNRNAESLGWKTTLRGPISIHVPGSETSLYTGTYCPHDDPYIWRSW